MAWVKYIVQTEKTLREILLAELSCVGFEGFNETATGLEAWIDESLYDSTSVAEILEQYHIKNDQIIIESVGKQNWNQLWESNYEPIVIDQKLRIRAPFHSQSDFYPYEITIEPKMSFGTGHHPTTALLLSTLLKMDLNQKWVADLGTGTGVLGILCAKMGAKHIYACDIEAWAYENAIENCNKNNVHNMEVVLGSVSDLSAGLHAKIDIVIANINKNILTEEMHQYISLMAPGATLLLSGFYVTDAIELENFVSSKGLSFQAQYQLDQWAVLHFKR